MGKEIGDRPPGKDIESSKDFKERNPEFISALENSRLAKNLMNVVLRLGTYYLFFCTPEGNEMLKIPEARRLLYDREARTGLLEGSIISNELYVPNKEGTSLELKSSTVAGQFVSYDFQRPKEFKSAAKKRDIQNDKGRLVIFALDEIKDNDKNVYTPTDLFNFFDVMHFLSFDVYSVEKAIQEGYITETTYGNAYKKVSLHSKYELFLGLQGLDNKPIYAVTPKGNGITCLSGDWGDKSEQRKKIGELKPAFAFPSI